MFANRADLVGQTIDGKYQVTNLLGRGGMGAVFRAIHLGTSRTVALKVIAPKFASEPEFLQRFQREAHACGRLRHPNIVDVTDFGVTDHEGGRLAYLVMEYLDGCSLAEVLRSETRLPLAWSVDVIEQVSSAIDEAHRHGILHRDLKPDNIWLEPNRRGGYTTKVLDFGLAKLVEEKSTPPLSGAAPGPVASSGKARVSLDIPALSAEAEATLMRPPPDTPSSEPPVGTTSGRPVDVEAPTLEVAVAHSGSTSLVDDDATRAGSVVGTPTYMSPEQIRGDPVTPRSDVYSLGVIAYLMIGGQPPFSGTTDEVLAGHIKGVPRPIREIRPDLPTDAADHLMAALAKDPGARPGSAIAFAAKLAARFETPTAFLHSVLLVFVAHIGAWLRLSILCSLPLLLASVAFSAMVFLDASGALDLHAMGIQSGRLPLIAGVAIGTLCFTVMAGATTPLAMQAVAAPLRPIAIGFVLRNFSGRLRGWLREMMPFLGIFLGFLLLLPLLGSGAQFVGEVLRPFARTLSVPLRVALAVSLILVVFSLPLGIGYLTVRRLGGVKAFQFLGGVMLVEGLTGEAARLRSSALFDQAGRTLQPLQIAVMIAGGAAGFLASLVSNLGERFIGPVALGGSIAPLLTVSLTLVAPFWSLVGSLTYLRARRAAGEPLDRVLAQFERAALPEDNWQLVQRERVRRQISLSR